MNAIHPRERHRSLRRPALCVLAVGNYGRDTIRPRVGDGDGGAGRLKCISHDRRIQVVHLQLQRRGRIFAELPFQVVEPGVKLGGLPNDLRI